MAKKTGKQSGFTLIELMVTILIASVVILGISGVLADAHRGFRQMYERIHGDIVNDAYAARLRFDKICRRAKANSATVLNNATEVRVSYYSIPNDTNNPYLPPDRYARFYRKNSSYPTDLMLDTGPIATGIPDTPTETVARNVTELQFSNPIGGRSVQMVMTLDKDSGNDSDYSITVTCGSITHN